MSVECGECERDLRGEHDPSCSRYKPYICANCEDGNHHWCERIVPDPEVNSECTCKCKEPTA